METIYIAGKINGLNDYKERFAIAEKQLQELGYITMNPAVLGEGFPYAVYMPICLPMLEACESIYMLSNWKDSKGARLEHEYAKVQNKKIIYEQI